MSYQVFIGDKSFLFEVNPPAELVKENRSSYTGNLTGYVVEPIELKGKPKEQLNFGSNKQKKQKLTAIKDRIKKDLNLPDAALAELQDENRINIQATFAEKEQIVTVTISFKGELNASYEKEDIKNAVISLIRCLDKNYAKPKIPPLDINNSLISGVPDSMLTTTSSASITAETQSGSDNQQPNQPTSKVETSAMIYTDTIADQEFSFQLVEKPKIEDVGHKKSTQLILKSAPVNVLESANVSLSEGKGAFVKQLREFLSSNIVDFNEGESDSEKIKLVLEFQHDPNDQDKRIVTAIVTIPMVVGASGDINQVIKSIRAALNLQDPSNIAEEQQQTVSGSAGRQEVEETATTQLVAVEQDARQAKQEQEEYQQEERRKQVKEELQKAQDSLEQEFLELQDVIELQDAQKDEEQARQYAEEIQRKLLAEEQEQLQKELEKRQQEEQRKKEKELQELQEKQKKLQEDLQKDIEQLEIQKKEQARQREEQERIEKEKQEQLQKEAEEALRKAQETRRKIQAELTRDSQEQLQKETQQKEEVLRLATRNRSDSNASASSSSTSLSDNSDNAFASSSSDDEQDSQDHKQTQSTLLTEEKDMLRFMKKGFKKAKKSTGDTLEKGKEKLTSTFTRSKVEVKETTSGKAEATYISPEARKVQKDGLDNAIKNLRTAILTLPPETKSKATSGGVSQETGYVSKLHKAFTDLADKAGKLHADDKATATELAEVTTLVTDATDLINNHLVVKEESVKAKLEGVKKFENKFTQLTLPKGFAAAAITIIFAAVGAIIGGALGILAGAAIGGALGSAGTPAGVLVGAALGGSMIGIKAAAIGMGAGSYVGLAIAGALGLSGGGVTGYQLARRGFFRQPDAADIADNARDYLKHLEKEEKQQSTSPVLDV